ncbi:MAG: hypothetical protein ACR2FN_02045 [Chitinophagaceae bacterium]
MKIIFAIITCFLFTACSTGVKKKILVMTRGDITVKDNNITVTEGNNYGEKEMNLNNSGKISLNITSPTGNFSVDVPADGFYILNLRKDTLIGSYQKIGRDLNSAHVISQDELKIKIDSLQKLLANQNVSTANRNFFITQNQLKKITDNTDANIYGPFQPYTFYF